MTGQLARALVSLHSRGWRARYGDEFTALLEELPAQPSIVADALLCAARSRARDASAVALLSLIAVALASSAAPRSTPPQVAVRARAVAAIPVCRSYSAVPASSTIAERRCLS